eukprot:Hpha_TRINITY_DN1936_c0_g1::TRINITY_DN1936_c0_g1_i1::g.31062::m.31062/K08994/yneE; putative membrane protein
MTVTYDNRTIFSLLFRWKGSAFTSIRYQVLASLVCSILAVLALQEAESISKSLDHDGGLVFLAAPVTFLVVFRSNIAYDRFWSGRGAIGKLVATTVSTARVAATYIRDDSREAQDLRKCIVRLLLLHFALAMDHLGKSSGGIRFALKGIGEPDPHFLTGDSKEGMKYIFLTDREAKWIYKALHEGWDETKFSSRTLPCGVVALWLSQVVEASRKLVLLDDDVALTLEKHIQDLEDAVSTASRISSTPLPFPYVQVLHCGLLTFCFCAPFFYVETFGWFTLIFGALLSMAFFGINAVGIEISDPFGDDPNDFPLSMMLGGASRHCISVLHQRQAIGQKDLVAMQGAFYAASVLDFRTVTEELRKLRIRKDICTACGSLKERTECCALTGLPHAHAFAVGSDSEDQQTPRTPRGGSAYRFRRKRAWSVTRSSSSVSSYRSGGRAHARRVSFDRQVHAFPPTPKPDRNGHASGAGGGGEVAVNVRPLTAAMGAQNGGFAHAAGGMDGYSSDDDLDSSSGCEIRTQTTASESDQPAADYGPTLQQFRMPMRQSFSLNSHPNSRGSSEPPAGSPDRDRGTGAGQLPSRRGSVSKTKRWDPSVIK